MEILHLKKKVLLQFIFRIIIYEELFETTYQFLGEILMWYGILDIIPDENDENQKILNLCDKATFFRSDNKAEYVKFCKQILNNSLQPKDSNYDDFKDDCNKLYIWLYFKMKKFVISDDIINKIFELPKLIENEENKNNYCPYFTFNDKKHNPENLMKLRIFNDNAATFQRMLKDNTMSNDCNLKTYIYECIGIYRYMNMEYCSVSDGTTEENRNSCEIINEFNGRYKSYIHNNEEIAHEFPELSSHTSLYVIDDCPVEGSYSDSFFDETEIGTSRTAGVSSDLGATDEISSLNMEGGRNTDLSSLEAANNYSRDNIISSTKVKDKNQGSSMSRIVSTTLGTVLGASSILALLYKVTHNFI
ncbi:hypothetical protein PCYB_003980 [Plasmodium cynomolgi strain B]|uniref:Uncharacterized protein n=1 Tax=Plasmodium cynomolgi (strain B) TaxID=1120755 RepID=K6V048_PLACD|nr:hypothetical protein PCYB_003980 [Plasmodium cynomolgi strain B]GAB69649.1 hypothetical protein PCYB_003980 [Plasmodium cynomolgi strain B]